MNPYYRYKKEKLLEKYQSAYDNLEDLKEAIAEYKKNNSRIMRNGYNHDYYIREESEKLIEEFCFNRLAYLDIFLGENKDKVILKYKDKE